MHWSVTLWPPLPRTWQAQLLASPYRSAYSKASYQCHCTECHFLWLAPYTQLNVFEFHSWCACISTSAFLRLYNIPVCGNVFSFFIICCWTWTVSSLAAVTSAAGHTWALLSTWAGLVGSLAAHPASFRFQNLLLCSRFSFFFLSLFLFTHVSTFFFFFRISEIRGRMKSTSSISPIWMVSCNVFTIGDTTI